MTGPLRDRFGFVARLDYYSPGDLDAIIRRSAAILDVRLDAGGAAEIARRARGTPRIANRLLKRVRDFAEVRGDGSVDEGVARRGLELFGVDELGLDKVDRAILDAVCARFGGGPGRPVDPVGERRRGDRHRRGRLRAVPPAARPAHAHAPGPGRHRRLAAPRAGAAAGAAGPDIAGPLLDRQPPWRLGLSQGAECSSLVSVQNPDG